MTHTPPRAAAPAPALFLIVCAVALLLTASVPARTQNASLDGSSQPETAPARRLLRQAIAAHGGNVYEDLQDLAVSFSGKWGSIGRRLQPILADSGFRTSSEERFLFRENVSFQWFVGPDGDKVVFRDAEKTKVYYNGRQTRDAKHLAATAAVLDLYEFLLIGPSWLIQREMEVTLVGEENLGGERHQLLEVSIRPGLGSARNDVLILWLHKESHVLQRVETNLSGFAPLNGRTLEVTLGGHQWHAGKLWPTEYLQRLDTLVKVLFHRWQLTGIEVDRGLSAEALSKIDRGLTDHPALRPASPISFSGNR